MGVAVPLQSPLDHELALAVGVDRALRRGLGNRYRLRQTVGGAGRGENDVAHPDLSHDVEQAEAIDDIVAEIELRFRDRLADIGESGKMHHRHDLEITHGIREKALVGEVANDERSPFHRLAMAVEETVEGD